MLQPSQLSGKVSSVIQWLGRPRRNSSRLAASLIFGATRALPQDNGKSKEYLGYQRAAFDFIYRVDVPLGRTRASTLC